MKNDTNKTDPDRVSLPFQKRKNMTYLDGLIDAIFQTHGVEARHIETAHVVEIFMAGFAWEGDVEVYEVEHPSGARRCYAWGYPLDDDPSRYQYVCVLGIGPVDSPRNAVVAALRAHAKNNRTNQNNKS
jgi:hypothetical protein